MPIALTQRCPCCRLNLHHCKRCWNKYHNGILHKDYEPPEYFGQPFCSEEVCEIMEKKYGIKQKIKPDKNRKYEEGDYGHPE